MTTKLITYQLTDNQRDYSAISEVIKSYPRWSKLMDRVWLIKTRKSASEVRTFLAQSINNRGKIFVIDLKTNSWGSFAVDQNVTAWIKDNLHD